MLDYITKLERVKLYCQQIVNAHQDTLGPHAGLREEVHAKKILEMIEA
jgi:hypothetical protein